MSEETTQTDGVETQTEAVAEGESNEPVETSTDEITETTDKASTVDPNNKRGGKSRKEKNAEKHDTPDEDLEFARSFRTEQQGITRKNKFDGTFKEAGFDANDREARLEAFEKEHQELLDLGLPEDKATEKALKLTLSSAQVEQEIKETEERSSGRQKATLPPTSTQSVDRTVYTHEQMSKLSQSEYNRIKDMEEEGKVLIRAA